MARSPRGWRSIPAPLILLRLFLGVTFAYAGVQKLLDPGFLHPGSADFVATQLQGFARGSPIAWILNPLARIPVLAGVGIALLEIAIGLGTLSGVAARAAAIGGLLVSVALWLSATWHVHPYFLGSDSVYAIAWGAYLLGLLERARGPGVIRDPSVPAIARHASPEVVRRRELLRGATLAGATLATAAAARVVAGTPAGATLAAAEPTTGLSTAGTTPGASGSPTPPPASKTKASASGHAIAGTPVAPLSKIPVGGAIAFQAPGGTPAALVRLSRNEVVAFSRVCTHAGCLVGYDAGQQILYCPCHGAEYDPARHAAVLGGPAPRPLEEIPVRIDPTTGEVVIPDGGA